MFAGSSRRSSCRWWGRAVQKGLFCASCMMLLVCFTFLDMQMSCYNGCERLSGDKSSAGDGNSFAFLSYRIIWKPEMMTAHVKSADEIRRQKEGRPGSGTRKLSSHTEKIFLYDLYRGHLDEYDDNETYNSVNYRDNVVNNSLAERLFGTPSTVGGGSPLQRWNLTVGRRLPHVLIIGVKKGGTRALLEILRLHPDVRAPGPEPHFFDRYYYKGLQWYRRQMPLSLMGQLTMEKTPSYLITPEVPARVANMSRDVRLLVVVRDPVTRAVSDYTQASSKRRDTRTFEDMAFLNASTGLVDTNWSAIKIGVYAKHLERWLRHFPPAHFHFVSGERLISDPVAELAEVQDFLGLRRVISAKHFFFNQTKGFPCLRRSEVSTVPHCLGKTKGRSHPYIPPSALQRLRDFYRPFNQKFYRMAGRNFAWQ